MKPVLITVVLSAALALSGCGLFKKKTSAASQGTDQGVVEYDDQPGTSGAPGSDGYPGPVEIGGGDVPAYGAGAAGAGGAGSGVTETPGSVIYFEYDSTSLNAEGQALVAVHGRYLSENPSARLRLEGHTDERGTREYNVGLGERRANAVHEALLRAGASAAQLSVVSYGEERAVSSEQSEQGWAQNRRVQIVRQ